MRARARWIEEGECSSAYFFRLKKKRGADRWIAAVRNDVGTIVLSPDELCQSFASFYSSLFSAESIDVAAQESLLNNVESSLPSDQLESCEGLLMVEECFEALTGMARRKAPGLVLSKSKGLWLGPWANRSDLPVTLDWSSVKIKVLGVFLGPGNLDVNWKPRIAAVENTLSSWRQRILSFHGHALVINALALSWVWYVASLIHMPPWVLGELLRLLFSFFWKGKKDLVARAVVVQAPSVGGCSVVDVKLKVQSLFVQWVRHFVMAQSSWSGFLGFWFHSVFNFSPTEVFSRPFAFSPRTLPPFYQSLLLAWRVVDVSFSWSCSALVRASTDPHQFALVSSMSA